MQVREDITQKEPSVFAQRETTSKILIKGNVRIRMMDSVPRDDDNDNEDDEEENDALFSLSLFCPQFLSRHAGAGARVKLRKSKVSRPLDIG